MGAKLFSVSVRDFLHGLFVAVGAAVFGTIYEVAKVVVAHQFDFSFFDWRIVAGAAVLAMLGYIQKKFFSDEQGKLGGKL